MITSRDDIAAYLELQKEIDLVIPRGSYKLVQNIEKSTRIPVLGTVWLDMFAFSSLIVRCRPH